MKRYWLFSWYTYEAYGGTGDLKGTFDTPEEAMHQFDGELERDEHARDNAEVVDIQRGSIYFWQDDGEGWRASKNYATS